MINDFTFSYKIFGISLLAGVVVGIFVGITRGINYISKRNFIVLNITDFLNVMFFGLTTFYVVNHYNMGKLRLFIVLGIITGLLTEQKTIGKIFAKLSLLVYNKINKVWQFVKTTKIYKTLLK